MPRRSRIDAAGALNHVMVRGIEKAVIFLHDADRNHFLERLGKILVETETLCYAWAGPPIKGLRTQCQLNCKRTTIPYEPDGTVFARELITELGISPPEKETGER